jgi:hypothetical protein
MAQKPTGYCYSYKIIVYIQDNFKNTNKNCGHNTGGSNVNARDN